MLLKKGHMHMHDVRNVRGAQNFSAARLPDARWLLFLCTLTLMLELYLGPSTS
jgi:hypothetical protein